MPVAVQRALYVTVAMLVGGALYIAWTRGPAMVLDLSGGIASVICM